MEYENIIGLIEAVSNSSLAEFEYKENDLKISLKKAGSTVQIVESGVMQPVASQTIVPETPQAVKESAGQTVKSPLVGTFYAAASPDDAPFVKVGDTVSKGQTLGIVEAMKLMNEIESEFSGVVREILIDNEQMVEYGQPLFVIE